MFQRKQRRFRRRPNGRNQMSNINGKTHNRLRTNSFSNGHTRNNFRTSLSVEKLFEKYSSLAKEAMSSGDKILSENYLQHADHFMRIIEDKNKNRTQNKLETINKPSDETKNTIGNISADKDGSPENKN